MSAQEVKMGRSGKAAKSIRVVTQYLWSHLGPTQLSVFGVVAVRDSKKQLTLDKLAVDVGGEQRSLDCWPKAGLSLRKGRVRAGFYRFQVAREQLEVLPAQTGVRLIASRSDGSSSSRALGYGRVTRRSRLFSLGDGTTRVFVRRGGAENLCLTVRERNHTDSLLSRATVVLARIAAALYRKPVVLLYEKESGRYEESASVAFEALVDAGHEHVRYILEADKLDRVPERYRKYVVPRFSFRHYYNFFCAKTMVGTELVSHAIELRTVDLLLLWRMSRGDFTFVFLQHGVMYMVSLDSKQRSFFRAGTPGFPKRAKIVCSSQLEARHFTELAGFAPEDMYVCGLPKFDHARRDEGAEKILIMPTWRPWEQNLLRVAPQESGYYRMLMDIYDAVPEELKAKTLILPHPLVKDALHAHLPSSAVWEGESYDVALSQAAMLITDYSSIAYDAFYRGASVVFWWKDKDECMGKYGGHLMLDESNVYAPVCYDSAALRETIENSYQQPRDPEHVARYEKIVEFHDGCNTQRLLAMLQQDGLLVERHTEGQDRQ